MGLTSLSLQRMLLALEMRMVMFRLVGVGCMGTDVPVELAWALQPRQHTYSVYLSSIA